MKQIRIKNLVAPVEIETESLIRILFPFPMWIPKTILVKEDDGVYRLPYSFVKCEQQRFNY